MRRTGRNPTEKRPSQNRFSAQKIRINREPRGVPFFFSRKRGICLAEKGALAERAACVFGRGAFTERATSGEEEGRCMITEESVRWRKDDVCLRKKRTRLQKGRYAFKTEHGVFSPEGGGTQGGGKGSGTTRRSPGARNFCRQNCELFVNYSKTADFAGFSFCLKIKFEKFRKKFHEALDKGKICGIIL